MAALSRRRIRYQCERQSVFCLEARGRQPRSSAHEESAGGDPAQRRRGGDQRLHSHGAGAVRTASLAGRALRAGRSRAPTALVSVQCAQGLLLVAHRNGAAHHAVHSEAARAQSASAADPGVVHHAAGTGTPLLSPSRWPCECVGADFLHDRSACAQRRWSDPPGCARACASPGGALDVGAPERRGRPGGHLPCDGECARSSLRARGYSADDPRRRAAKRALQLY